MNARVAIADVAMFPERLLDLRIAQLGIDSFENTQASAERQATMMGRLARYGFDAHAAFLSSKCRGLNCDSRACPAACHVASRLHRAEIILAESELFRHGGEDVHFFTVVPSAWRVAHDKLDAFEPKVVAGLVTRALRSRDAVASFNVELVLCREDDETYWAPHVHGIAKGRRRITIFNSLRDLSTESLTYRPVVVRTVPSQEVPITLNYATKRVDELKVRYFDQEMKPRWRHVPLSGRDQATIDAWRCDRLADAMHFRIGFKRNGRFLVRT
ncbi:hypothetical protein [Xanthobacter versatilis]|uniref:hypothetical protein n=1 Tax=Xanthobacter autotrophicus (strain ATCC BAA-1158 / Py2) TaxID=78245 RepID=UPI00372647DF